VAINQEFIDSYKKLLILQYRNEIKAEADIGAKASHFSKIYELGNRFLNEFDLDNATGHRLDIIGKIVGFSRIISDVVEKSYFGFADNALMTGMNDKFSPPAIPLFPFLDKFEDVRGATELNDSDYKTFIVAKISKNTGSGTIGDNNGRIGIQNALLKISDGLTVVDNYDMTLTITVDSTVDPTRLNIIKKLDLIPRPMGVGLIFV